MKHGRHLDFDLVEERVFLEEVLAHFCRELALQHNHGSNLLISIPLARAIASDEIDESDSDALGNFARARIRTVPFNEVLSEKTAYPTRFSELALLLESYLLSCPDAVLRLNEIAKMSEADARQLSDDEWPVILG